MARIKPLQWDRRSEGLSVCHFLGRTYTLLSFDGFYSLVYAGSDLYGGDSEEEALKAAQDHAQDAVSAVLMTEGEE